jgi:hypothetical protein
MASYLDTLTVTADASVQMTLRFCGCITDTADAQVSPFSQVRTNTIVDSAVAAATLTGRRGITMVDSAAASSVLTESAHFVDVLAAGAVAVGDIIAARLTLNLVDTAVAAASLSGQMSLNINDAANAQSTLTAGRRGNDVIVANALARDSLSARRGIVITDAGVATASLAATRRGNDAIVDSANAAASVNATRRLLDSLFGTASANALLSGVLHARDTLVDTAEGEVVLLQPSLKRSAFWTNARTFAGAEWRAVLFNSIAQRDARVFAAGAQGIYELVDDAADGAAARGGRDRVGSEGLRRQPQQAPRDGLHRRRHSGATARARHDAAGHVHVRHAPDRRHDADEPPRDPRQGSVCALLPLRCHQPERPVRPEHVPRAAARSCAP